MTRQPKVARPSSSLLEGERAYRILYTDEYLDPRIRAAADLARLIRKLQGTARTGTNGRPGSKNAQGAKELEQLLEETIRRTEIRRSLRTADIRTEHNRGARQKERTDNKQKRQREPKIPPFGIPPSPSKPEPPTEPPTDKPDIPETPDRTRIDRPESDDVYPTDSEPPTEPIPRLRPRDEDLPTCQEVQRLFKAIGIPPPVCGGTQRTTSIRGSLL